ncbi:nucleolar pre-ribosomal-associated protein 1-like [Homarus americanus]|uniref:Nucleolar pre-ribosomal-associated protein 1-like n=1 Tax=Homarus americanus TaxID=6706 RepID=A0A8J5N9A4_HOMAM|nr:nucleolar pre-ribosomal-associated protein 1-like [Homarus americanus]XP_042210507.1 nucleolar pre-ribosomal-associated protein 1-like [Homarus americanus]KAG7175228.1 Nucleolar pre-ribosomal-associated protein 1-like [Homarus americanus]
MKISTLIEELSGKLPVAALDEFNTSVEEKGDAQGVIHRFLLASKNCDEILDLLLVDKRTGSELTTVFTALGHILFNIAGELKDFSSVGLHITRQLLHNHDAFIYKLLTPTSTNKACKAVLRCLTGMVMVGGEAANEVLLTLDWHLINISILVSRQSMRDVRDVRAWCIYLFLAFLNVSDEPLVIKQFLQKKDLLSAIFPGLMWDPCERVINVLKVMHESVLLNPDISKTMKVNLFTPATAKSLLDLYNWMGPLGKLAKGGSVQDMDIHIGGNLQKERAQIIEVLHKFLYSLCCSTKHGILFQEKLQEGRIQSNNWCLYKIVSNLKTPWKSPEQSELISGVLGACPDLLQAYLKTLKDFLTPRPTKSFISLINMLTQIIEQQKPWKKLDTRGIAGVFSCLLPRPLDVKFFQSLVGSCYKSIRHCGLMLVFAILSKIQESIDNIMKNEAYSQEVKEQTRRKLVNSVFRVQGSVKDIVQCWNVATGQEAASIQDDEKNVLQEDTADPVATITELLTIAKVLTVYTQLLPKQTFQELISPLEMLQTVRVLPTEGSDSVKNTKDKLELQMLCLGIIAGSKQSQEVAVDSSLRLGDQNQQIEKSIIFQLISTYAQSKREFMATEGESAVLSVGDRCLEILSNFLAQTGLSFHYDGNIKFWLRHISGSSIVKLSSFLTQIIQKTVSSLSHYTDHLVEIGNKNQLNTSIDGQVSSFVTELGTMEVTDNEDVSALSISFPFSRLVLATIDLLESYLDSEYIQYFSNVIEDYLLSLSDPGFLADILLQNENILTTDLKNYLKCMFKKSETVVHGPPSTFENANLSEILKYLFLTRDWSSVKTMLEGHRLKELMDKTDLDLVVLQLLLYLYLDSCSEKNGDNLIEKYIGILKCMCTIIEEDSDKNFKQVIQAVLDHPRILANYKPFSLKKSPITELAQEFIELVLEKHPSLAPKTCSYFEKILREIKIPVNNRDIEVEFWKPVAPFITLKNTVASYEAVEQLLIICLKDPCHLSHSQDILVLELVKLLLKVTSAKRMPTTQSVQLLLTSYIEWCRTAEENETLEAIMKHMEQLLTRITSEEVAAHLTTDDIKCLVRARTPCVDLCCQLMKLHPSHGTTLVKHLKSHRAVLPSQAPLLALLLDQDETMATAELALAKVSRKIKLWALDIDGDDDATSILFALALKKNLIDDDSLSEICCQLYEKMVTQKHPPPKKFLSLVPVFHKLSNSGPVLPKFDLPEEDLALLNICLCFIRSTYQKELQNTNQLLNVSNIIKEILPKLGQSSYTTLAPTKIWSSFVKQVLRNGLSDQSVGPDLIHTLNLLCANLYKKVSQGRYGEDSSLPVTTLYQMIMAHSQYLTLMFNRAEEWGRLKEEVVALQQTLVDCEETVCQENHIPILLGAYGASMSAVDQRILKLLHTYEGKGYMNDYQPILWGDTAVAHFGVHSSSIGLVRDPKPEEILNLLNMDKIMQTCYKFNTRLPLEPGEVQKEDPSIYDIRFLIPLMLFLADGDKLYDIDYAECGAVALGFIAMTSHEREVWGSGAALLRCMVEKMEVSRHRRLKLPWLWLVGVVSFAFGGKQRRLPALTTHFLIRASQLLSQPDHPMYQPVLNYLFIRPAFELYYVPELYEFYNSDHITDNRLHRSFLLTTLSTGIRQILDYRICQKTYTNTLMIAMLQAPSVDNELRVQVLEVLEAIVRIHLGAVELVRNQNLLTVLPLVALPVNTAAPKSDASSRVTTSGNPIILAAVLNVLSALWSTVIDSITRKDITANYPAEDEENEPQEPECEDDRKRKRVHEDGSKYRKKMKKDYTDNDSQADEPRKKMLPPLFIHEFLNCLSLLTPTVISYASLATTTQHLVLLADYVQYVDTIAEIIDKKDKFRSVALAPEVIKQKVFDNIGWDLLYDRLQERLSDDDEIKLLGSKAISMREKWLSEPLAKYLQKKEKAVSLDKDKDEPLQNLRNAAIKLLSVLGK